jgi:hypothetical protein
MKSAEESDFVYSLHVKQRQDYWKLKQQIQLDAMREGMRMASEICLPKTKREYLLSESACKQRILSAAKQLTEKDL